MCGIVGIWNYRSAAPVDRGLLAAMRDQMLHRGPDDAGDYFDDAAGLGLGFRRLSIIDLSPAGHQPMCNEDGRVWLVFNGEIYNFQALRPALEARGHTFRSRSDTEVILHQYEEYGPDAIADLWGMFGLAIWDGRTRRLTLARDRLGKKPLYYYDDGERILFASELKAILCHRAVPRRIDLPALAEYLALGYVGAPRTIMQGIAKLEPGHLLVHNGRSATRRRYWDWLAAFAVDQRRSEADWCDELRTTLREAVRARMVSDVPLGAFLSGGVDSSAVVATMAELSDRPVKTFSIGFADDAFNELPYAREVAQRFGTDHHELIVEPESLADLLPRLVYQFDEPFGDSSAVPTSSVARIARRHVTVCLSGDGGDEAFAGYPRYYRALFETHLDRIPQLLRSIGLPLMAGLLPPHTRARWLARRQLLPPMARYAYGMQTFYSEQAAAVLAPDAAAYVEQVPAFLMRSMQPAAGLDYLSQLQYLDGVSYLPEDILVKVDRTSMWHSLEVRSPLLDHRILELAARIPPQLRLRGLRDGKYIFKRVMRGVLPDSVLDRPKQGFGIPGRRWLKEDVPDFVHDVLSP
ncbi:MAG TPA: asparagine synthase (glutamine-hydrolyzing), partial [Roseiflexaceae bacterium]|nr:asparagine synthase (glutamine-hydrolyzing) [Roseiflexaceae bacterium]